MNREYARVYSSLYHQHWWFRAREEFLLDSLFNFAANRDGALGPILDVGCGDGLFLRQLSQFGEVEGLEPDIAIVSAETQQSWKIHLCNFDRHFSPETRYGLILLLDVLEHLEDAPAALHHAHSLLRPGGVLMVTVPAFRCLWTSQDHLNHHWTRYTLPELEERVIDANFRIIESRFFFHWLFFGKLFLRAKEFLVRTPGQPPASPMSAVNTLLLRLCRIEQLLSKRHSPPFGSSILLLAQRNESEADRRTS